MPELRQLDLQLALEAARALRKNIQDQAGAIQHAAIEFAFEIAFLAWAEFSAGDDQFGIVSRNTLAQLVHFAAADEVACVGTLARTDDFVDHDGACRAGQLRKFLTFDFVGCALRARMDEDGTFAALRSLKQTRPPEAAIVA